MWFVHGGVWFLARPRPTSFKMLAVMTSHATADLRRHDINTAGKRHHRFSGLAQRDADLKQACKMLSQLTFGEVIHRLTDVPIPLA